MGVRRVRRDLRQKDMRESRIVNGMRKTKERDRREIRIMGLVKDGKLPYTPVVLSWLSNALNKPGRLITQDDVKKLLAAKK
ncbi:MAG: hypothetical protein ACJ8C4_18865 [Gemmataceae bacterium]